jgi:NADH-quinone oxidoreductase subunit L
MLLIEKIAILLVFLPLISAAVVGLTTRIISARLAQIITCSFLFASAFCAYYLFNEVALKHNIVELKLLSWFSSAKLQASWSIYIDSLTAVMLVVVTTVSSLVHLYSVGYMSHDEFKPRFMCYLSLFTFCMLMLVSADNFIQLFFGWEGVGLCSYLLIGFWFKKPSANAAAIKAFLVNRVGDFGFALGIFLLFWTFDSVEYKSVFASVESYQDSAINLFGFNVQLITVICLLLFMGAMGKSAQIGLHTWLPDAMEGPTPVSALIHAATMVTAGVFMVARCSPLFEYSEVALGVVTLVGAFTALFAASVALVQNDIKRIIAYSTCSQLGYMFFACGVSAYSAGIFHLMTHAFFKALLFLGAGSVIHAMSDEQDIRKMGGIWKKIPFTYSIMWIGSLALAGIYPFAGYFSKDIILESAYASGTFVGYTAFALGICAALFTAFYSWRLLLLTFHGEARATQKTMDHVHESPLSMTIPLFFLAIGSLLAGYIGAVKFGMVDHLGEFWQDAILVGTNHNALEHAHHVPSLVALAPLLAGLVGIGTAYLLYMFKPQLPEIIYSKAKKLYAALLNKWYFDEFYDLILVKQSKRLGNIFWRKVDMVFIDGIPNGLATLTALLARATSILQSGYIYHYAFAMLLGLLCILSWALLLMK